MLFWTDSKVKVNQVASSTLEAIGIWIVVTAGWVLFLFFLKKIFQSWRIKTMRVLKICCGLLPRYYFFLACYSAVWWAVSQGDYCKFHNSFWEMEKVLISAPVNANHNKKWHLPFVCCVIAWTAGLSRKITLCPDLKQKQMNIFFQEDFQWNMVIKIVSILL